MNEYFIFGFVAGFISAVLLWMYSRYVKRTAKVTKEEIEIDIKVNAEESLSHLSDLVKKAKQLQFEIENMRAKK